MVAMAAAVVGVPCGCCLCVLVVTRHRVVVRCGDQVLVLNHLATSVEYPWGVSRTTPARRI